MISNLLDLTDAFNADHEVVIDTGGNRFISIQFVSPSTTVNLTGTNDGGGVLGTSDGSAATATNFVSIGGYNLTAPLTVVTSIAASGILRVDCQCKYIKLAGTNVTATKVIAMTGKLL